MRREGERRSQGASGVVQMVGFGRGVLVVIIMGWGPEVRGGRKHRGEGWDLMGLGLGSVSIVGCGRVVRCMCGSLGE